MFVDRAEFASAFHEGLIALYFCFSPIEVELPDLTKLHLFEYITGLAG